MRKRGIVTGVVGASVVTVAALRGMLRRFEIKESSMAPALESGDWIVARRRVGDIGRGDIVVFDDPADTGMSLIKRVVGLGGETVSIESGQVVINGALLADPWASGITPTDGSWFVPEGHVWVLGDNRIESRSDGRTIGPIPVNAVGWQAIARYWPTSRAGSLA
ncbi:MAG: signal peptidase I [Acidimicrobiia bacterium]|nr:signal peptidase I [Acidimicrobiia bacterium]